MGNEVCNCSSGKKNKQDESFANEAKRSISIKQKPLIENSQNTKNKQYQQIDDELERIKNGTYKPKTGRADSFLHDVDSNQTQIKAIPALYCSDICEIMTHKSTKMNVNNSYYDDLEFEDESEYNSDSITIDEINLVQDSPGENSKTKVFLNIQNINTSNNKTNLITKTGESNDELDLDLANCVVDLTQFPTKQELYGNSPTIES
eukprot:423508_1